MYEHFNRWLVILVAIGGLTLVFCLLQLAQVPVQAQTGETSGALTVLDASGKAKSQCPLKHTDVKAEISGFLSRVVVTQQFQNPFQEKIEAVYTFPLPQNAAVDDMTMIVGDRTVKGKILRREEAQAVYEAAKSNGQVASLLDQERPNIFTQSVANILPGQEVKITISYVETLKYEKGAYEFMFPMVVAPRYIPKPGDSDAPGVADASRLNPKVTPAGTRSGHDISLDVTLDAGLMVDSVNSSTHVVEIERPDVHTAHVRLRDNATIPNKDFILRYDVAGKSIQDALLTHRSGKGGFFTMILQPPEQVTVADVTPKELVFVLDTSGSMQGFPIEKAKETMKLALDSLYPSDTFNLITFAGDTQILFPAPVRATKANLSKAQAFLSSRSGSGGTEMMTAIKAALEPSDAQDHMRIVCFMTDGEVGNDMEIISEVQKHPNARVFAFGIGSSVNRFLLDKISDVGRGEVEYVGLGDDGSAAAKRFHERIRNPLLTDIAIDWNGLPVADVYPQRIPDLFSAKPVVLTGRYTSSGSGTLRLKGKLAGSDFVREIPVAFPENDAQHDVLASLWARNRVDDLMGQDWAGVQQGKPQPDLKETITQLGLEYRLLTQFTSFVAVEEMIVTDGGQPRRVDVPVEVPEGTIVDPAEPLLNSNNAVMGYVGVAQVKSLPISRGVLNPSPSPSRSAKARTGSGSGAGIGGGRGGNVGGGNARTNAPPSVAVSAASRDMILEDRVAVGPLTDEEKNEAVLRAKLQPTVMAVVERLKKKDVNPGKGETRFIRDGKAELQVWLTDKTPEKVEQLKALGLEVIFDSKSSKLVIGRLPIEKLEALAKLDFVRYVSPQFSSP